MRRFESLALAGALILAGCASAPAAGKVAVVLDPPVSSLGGAGGEELGRKALAALTRVVAASEAFVLAESADKAGAHGQTELAAASARSVTVRFRIVDNAAGTVLDSFSATVAQEAPAWAWTFQKRWAEERKAAGSTPEALMTLLRSPRGTRKAEDLLRLRFLDLVREAAPRWDAALSPDLAAAFRARFGRDLAVLLDRPALVLVEGGTGYLGSDQGESDEGPLHSVTVPSFLMARTEVTQGLYEAVTGTNPSLFTTTPDAPRRPVERVSWFDAVEFCNQLSALEGLEPVYTIQNRSPAQGWPIRSAEVTQNRAKNGYRLPTEAEWEWAARGGVLSQNQTVAGGDPSLAAWTGGTAGPGPVAEKAANELGLYDLGGNVWEWCWDWYGRYEGGPGNDPEGPGTGVLKVGRGGSWQSAPWMSRVSARSFDSPGSRGSNLGFRVVRSSVE